MCTRVSLGRPRDYQTATISFSNGAPAQYPICEIPHASDHFCWTCPHSKIADELSALYSKHFGDKSVFRPKSNLP